MGACAFVLLGCIAVHGIRYDLLLCMLRGQSVCLVTNMNPAKRMDGSRCRLGYGLVGPRNHLFGGDPDPFTGRGFLSFEQVISETFFQTTCLDACPDLPAVEVFFARGSSSNVTSSY